MAKKTPAPAPAAPVPQRTSTQPRIGGSFAPPIDEAKLAEYRGLTDLASPQVKDAMTRLCLMVDRYHNLPRRERRGGAPHPSGAPILARLLHQDDVEALDEHVPWDYECNAIQTLFDAIPPEQKGLRDAAFHLLWYAKELTLDREPLTNDQLLTG